LEDIIYELAYDNRFGNHRHGVRLDCCRIHTKQEERKNFLFLRQFLRRVRVERQLSFPYLTDYQALRSSVKIELRNFI